MEVLFPLVRGELERRARYLMSLEKKGHTLQPKVLVDEAYVRLVGPANYSFENRRDFFSLAAKVMRDILVDWARASKADKRGGGQVQLPVTEGLLVSTAKSEELLALDQALTRLEKLDPQQSQIVELRFFGGLSVKEIATTLGISERTVKREWSTARLWLYSQIGQAK